MLTYRPPNRQTQAQAFPGLVRAVLKNHPLYSVVTCTQPGRAEKVDVIKRKCVYEDVKDKNMLLSLVISRNLTGVQIDDELLSFTYPSISKDIEAAVRDKFLVRMQLIGKSPESGYLFYNL